jgi:hypothetical protein
MRATHCNCASACSQQLAAQRCVTWLSGAPAWVEPGRGCCHAVRYWRPLRLLKCGASRARRLPAECSHYSGTISWRFQPTGHVCAAAVCDEEACCSSNRLLLACPRAGWSKVSHNVSLFKVCLCRHRCTHADRRQQQPAHTGRLLLETCCGQHAVPILVSIMVPT